MKLCILDNDILDGPLTAKYTSFTAMFERLFRDAGANWTITAFNTMRGEFPDSFDEFDAVLLTGSHADSFSQEPWVVALRERVQHLLETKKKLLGVCFGHQLIGLCLGAKVGRAPQGWGAGRMTYEWHAPHIPHAPLADAPGARAEISLLASHQDQVFELPPGATLLASSVFCPVAAFAVNDEVFCIQPHPEFVEDFSSYLLDKRRPMLGEEKHAASIQSLAKGHDGLDVARMMVAFVEGKSAA
jgi:GMP synthase-like glutamine amidotransferase